MAQISAKEKKKLIEENKPKFEFEFEFKILSFVKKSPTIIKLADSIL